MAMIKNQKHVFWIALLATLFLFNFGIYLGYTIENSRLNQINSLYANSELNLLDIKIMSEIFNYQNFDCKLAVQENIDFANKIYDEAKLLEKYDNAKTFSTEVKTQHKKYDLLRTLFWINSMNLKQKCNAGYHNIIYFYDYVNPTLEQKAKQSVFSRILMELKQKKGNDVMLIPIAADNDISSVNLFLKSYNISEFPVILIDEKIQITQLENITQIEKAIS